MPAFAFLGRSILRPFRRDQKGDFANGTDTAIVRSAIGQIIGTRASVPGGSLQGELPWRGDFGSIVHLLKHAPNNVNLSQIARAYVVDALKRWETRIVVGDVFAEKRDADAGKGRVLFVSVQWRLIDRNVPGNQVFWNVDEVSVPLT